MSKNFPKFKFGDKVETQYGLKAKVVSIIKQGGNFLVSVEDSKGSRTEHKEDTLIFDSKYLETKEKVHIGTMCPVCQTKYKITRFGAKEWKDCIKCKKTAEQLCQEAANPDTDDDQLDFGLWDVDSWKTF